MFISTVEIVIYRVIFIVNIFNSFTYRLNPTVTITNCYCCNNIDVYRFFDICLTQITPNIIDVFCCRFRLYIARSNNDMLIVVFIIQHSGNNVGAWNIESLWKFYHLWYCCIFRHIEDINAVGVRSWWSCTANEECNICITLSNCCYAAVLIWPDICCECGFV